jgi:chitin disaccharide deacetylase
LKRLIINADDFGFTHDVNAGIVHAHQEGVLTSTTLMANGDAFEGAVRLAFENPALDVGCHLVLVQGRSLLTGKPLPQNLQNVVLDVAAGRINPYDELRVQVEKILATGLRPTHLDSHKHTHILPQVFRATVRLAHEFNIPFVRLPVPAGSQNLVRRLYVRLAKNRNVAMTDHFLGFRLTGKLTEESFAHALQRIPEGLSEFMCHPGYLGAELQAASTRLKDSRLRELEALTSPRIRDIIAREPIHLTTFGTAALPGIR